MRTYTEQQIRGALKAQVEARKLRGVAEDTGLSRAFVSAVATGKRPPSPAILGYLGYERIEQKYRRIANPPKAAKSK